MCCCLAATSASCFAQVKLSCSMQQTSTKQLQNCGLPKSLRRNADEHLMPASESTASQSFFVSGHSCCAVQALHRGQFCWAVLEIRRHFIFSGLLTHVQAAAGSCCWRQAGAASGSVLTAGCSVLSPGANLLIHMHLPSPSRVLAVPKSAMASSRISLPFVIQPQASEPTFETSHGAIDMEWLGFIILKRHEWTRCIIADKICQSLHIPQHCKLQILR